MKNQMLNIVLTAFFLLYSIFTWPTMSWFKSSPDASAQNTSVQFISAASTTVDFGLHNPADFLSSADPTILMVMPKLIAESGGISVTKND